MKRIILLGFFLGTYCLSNAHQNLDSLFRALKTLPENNPERLNVLVSIGMLLSKSNESMATKYFLQARALAEKTSSKEDLGWLLNDVGAFYSDIGKIDLSFKYTLEAKRVFDELKNHNGSFKMLDNLVNMYIDLKNEFKWQEYFRQETAIYPLVTDIYLQQDYYNTKAFIHSIRKERDSTLFTYRQILQLAATVNDTLGIKQAYHEIGLFFLDEKKFDSAEHYFTIALQDLKGPYHHFLKLSLYTNLGRLHAQKGNYPKAEEMFNRCNEFATKYKYHLRLLDNQFEITKMYEQRKDYFRYSKALKTYYQLKDSIYNLTTNNKLVQLEQAYVQELNDKKIEEQKVAKRFYLALSALLMFSVIVVIFYLYKMRSKNRSLEEQKKVIENKSEEILLQKEELQKLNHTKDKLFRVISHDLRNPMITLSSYLDADEGDNLNQKKNKASTTESLHQSIALLDNLLVWASSQLKEENVLMQRIDLDDWLDEVLTPVQIQANKKNIRIEQAIKPEANVISSDPEMLSIVLRNLLTNAVKFSPSNSRIVLNTISDNKLIQLQIKDEGIGMNEEQRNALLENRAISRSGTEQEKGSGLGMPIVFDLLKQLNIRWYLQSEEGKGTCITMWLQGII